MTKYYNVLPFNKDNLIESFLNKKERTENLEKNDIKKNAINRLRKNSHIKFIHELLEKKLQCKTIIVEYDYTDLDYLHDFAFYHVRCHEKYESVCTRLHFFTKEITEDSFLNLLGLLESKQETRNTQDNNTEDINESYLGFIVARPLPKTIIGRTILIPPRDGMTYFCTREYSANLFGIQLSIPGSLAFQQQDRSVAACATIALWSAFHKVSELFTTTLPQASTITQSATVSYSEHRSFPSNGLTIQQMRNAITNLGLEAQIQQGGFTALMPAIYAYMKMNIPIILNMSCVQETTDKNNEKHYHYIGEHAITLVGYKNSVRTNTNLEALGINIKNNLISHLSVHDDQIGPFTVLSVIQKEGNEKLFGELVSDLASSNTDAKKVSRNLDPILLCYDGNHDNRNERSLFIPSGFLIPIYQKIRVSFADIYRNFKKIHDIIRIIYMEFISNSDVFEGIPEEQKQEKLLQLFRHLEWEILLTTNNELKKDIKDTVNKKIDVNHDSSATNNTIVNARKILLSQHPKYVWQIILRNSKTKTNIFDIYADATGTPQAFPLYNMMWYQEQIKTLLQVGINKKLPDLEKYNDDPEFEFLKKNSF